MVYVNASCEENHNVCFTYAGGLDYLSVIGRREYGEERERAREGSRGIGRERERGNAGRKRKRRSNHSFVNSS